MAVKQIANDIKVCDIYNVFCVMYFENETLFIIWCEWSFEKVRWYCNTSVIILYEMRHRHAIIVKSERLIQSIVVRYVGTPAAARARSMAPLLICWARGPGVKPKRRSEFSAGLRHPRFFYYYISFFYDWTFWRTVMIWQSMYLSTKLK